jgi:hypothetical protein
VVFDKDSFKPHQFNSAIMLAVSQGFGVAYSNQSFEYWLILHFNDHQGGGMNRRLYHAELNHHLGKVGLAYDGKRTKEVSPEVFDHMLAVDPAHKVRRVDLAIRRAKSVEQFHTGKTPAQSESSTTVYRLVEILLKHVG